MLICRTNTDSMLYIHEATCTTDGLLIGSLGFNPNTLPRGESSRRPFLLPIASANRCAITRNSANRETLYTDECFMNHGTAALCKGLLKTGKWLTLAFGSRYERLIIELHRSANNSMPGGYMVKRKGRSTFTWFMHPQKKGIYEIH